MTNNPPNLIWSRGFAREEIANRRAENTIRRFWHYLWCFLTGVGALSLVYLLWLVASETSELGKVFIEIPYCSLLFWLGCFAALMLIKNHFSKKEDKSATIAAALARSKKNLLVDEFFDAATLATLDAAYRDMLSRARVKSQGLLPFCLLLKLLETENGSAIAVRLGTDPGSLKTKIRRLLTTGAASQQNPAGDFGKSLIYKAFEQALKTDKYKVEIADLFWSLCVIPSNARDFLLDYGIDEKNMTGVHHWLLSSSEIEHKLRSDSYFLLNRDKPWRNTLWTSTVTPLLDTVGRDLTAVAGRFYPLIDRDEELEKMYELIADGTPGLLLVGPQGSGMTKLIEGLAQKIVSQKVPPALADRRVLTISLAKMLSISNPQAPIKALAQQLTKEIQRSGNIILVIEDLPALEAVKTEEAAIIVEQLLLDALNNKRLILLATADIKSLHDSSGSLINSLQRVDVKPLTDELTLDVLETMAPYLEHEYRVLLTYNALRRIVDLSRYLHELAQPAQSVQLLRRICERRFTGTSGDRSSGWFKRSPKTHWNSISAETVEQEVAAMTKLPLAQVTRQETDLLLNLEKRIYEKYVNQSAAVTAVASALRRARTKISDQHRPIGTFLFLGPTGVGKTELARRLAEIYFKSRERMIRLDMSEYQETQSLRNLIGAPPGTGSTEEGSLIKAVKENPFSVILLDELEKAHPDILNIFLQVMEDGRLTSSTGETYDFSSAIIIGTSNAGASYIEQALNAGLPIEQIEETLKKQELHASFKPEFLNRFDSIVVFKPLSFENVLIISQILLRELEAQLAEQGIVFVATSEAIQDVAQAGFNPAQGARPLRRVIQDKIEDEIAKLILNKKIKQRDKIILKKDFAMEIEQARHY